MEFEARDKKAYAKEVRLPGINSARTWEDFATGITGLYPTFEMASKALRLLNATRTYMHMT
jgi:hypothetical protein